MKGLMFSILPLDVKIEMASYTLNCEYKDPWHQSAWFKMMLVDAEFAAYAKTEKGMRLFVSLFECLVEEPDFEIYYLMNRIHRGGDLPAITRYDGNCDEIWVYNGNIHRDGDLPARINKHLQVWYKHGKIHRDGDLPAYIDTSRTNESIERWYKEDMIHRDGDLPAEISSSGWQEWKINGKLHRDGDKPARIMPDGTQEWYYEGRIHRENDKPARIIPDGSCIWFNMGKFHRKQGASVITDKSICYYINDVFIGRVDK